MLENFYKTLFTLGIAALFFIVLKNVFPKSNVEIKAVTDTNIVVDSLLLQEIQMQKRKDSVLLEEKKKIIEKDSILVLKNRKDSIKSSHKNRFSKVPNTALVSYKTNLELNLFYKKLAELENNKNAKVRIAYFGDSMNDGDLIVQDLRKFFQKKYGGKGIGFVNIYSESAKNRGSVKHNFSNNWLHSSFLKRINTKSLGISGYTAFTDSINNNSWVSYQAGYYPSKNLLFNPTLYYGKSSDSTFIYLEEDGIKTAISLQGKNILNTQKITGAKLSKFKLIFDTKETPIYGIDFATKNGIHIDNFSTRGNSGLGLTRLRYDLTTQFQKKFQYDLIILQFGTNVVSYKNKSYGWYKKGMKRVIKHLNTIFPKADILVFSIADKSRKYDLEMKTDSAVYPLLKSQYYLAKETNSSFLSLYELMGGNNSMVTWVEEEPNYARKDYTHFNSSGSRKIAWLIFNEFEKGFKNHKKKKEITKIIKKNNVNE